MTLVDTNVLLDLVTADPQWADWSIAALEAASLSGPLLINDVVYAELSIRYERIEMLDEFVSKAGLELVECRDRPCSSPERLLLDIARQAAPETACCLTFSLAPMQRFYGCHY